MPILNLKQCEPTPEFWFPTLTFIVFDGVVKEKKESFFCELGDSLPVSVFVKVPFVTKNVDEITYGVVHVIKTTVV